MKQGFFPHSTKQQQIWLVGLIILVSTRDQKCKRRYENAGEIEKSQWYVTQLITSQQFLLFWVSLLTLIKNTPLLSKWLKTGRLTVRAMLIREASWKLVATSPSFLPAQRSCKGNFLADYFANITESSTTAKVYHSLLFSFRLFFFTLDYFKGFIQQSK